MQNCCPAPKVILESLLDSLEYLETQASIHISLKNDKTLQTHGAYLKINFKKLKFVSSESWGPAELSLSWGGTKLKKRSFSLHPIAHSQSQTV